ncbi:hypothetical protein RKD29_006811 [Streptomyces tendae]|uniref:hypothetical protein n=1 Tax=Streptomyces TaxID=1883 RepID=UPI003838F820
MPTTGRFLDIRRDPHSGELLARGGDAEAHSILQRAGFVAVVRLHESYHRAPAGLTEDEESRLATDAVGRLRAVGYHVDCDERFDTEARPASYPTLGASVSHSPNASARPPTPPRQPTSSPRPTTASSPGSRKPSAP